MQVAAAAAEYATNTRGGGSVINAQRSATWSASAHSPQTHSSHLDQEKAVLADADLSPTSDDEIFLTQDVSNGAED